MNWKRFVWCFLPGLLTVAAPARSAVPELTALVPEAKEYELIAKFNPLNFNHRNYLENRADGISGKLTRIGYLIRLTSKNHEKTWVFVSMDSFCKRASEALVPKPRGTGYQQYVSNLEIKSNVPLLKTGHFIKGNVEIWGENYSGFNAEAIPGANQTFDFGDQRDEKGGYGSFQIHNFMEKQTVFAFNNFSGNATCDLGIGNASEGNPDWTFSKSGTRYSNAEIMIVGKFDGFQFQKSSLMNGDLVNFSGTTDKDPLSYRPGEPITFTLRLAWNQPMPEKKRFIEWTRTGDDGKCEKGKVDANKKMLTVTTSLKQPGFVRLYARIVDADGRADTRTNWNGGRTPLAVDCGAAVEPEKLTGSPEPDDFDVFWAAQRARLDQVPLRAELKKMPQSSEKVRIYAVKVSCAGPRPMTGYLTIPVGAAPKSLPAMVNYPGYGYTAGKEKIPVGALDHIDLRINAHGYDLGESPEYYRKFGKKIRSRNFSYAFDPQQNADPEKAYFNGMALRVMRSLDFVKSLPEWNGRDLTVRGGSQGGLQTVWAAGLDRSVTLALPEIPWCCDMGGAQNFKRLAGSWRIEYLPAMEYYDPIHFAKRIKCPVTIPRAGLGDYICPPSGVAVFFNNLRVPKKIKWFQNSTHGYIPAQPQIIVRQLK